MVPFIYRRTGRNLRRRSLIYGLGEANRKNIETLMQYSLEQGMIRRKMTMEELFIDTTSV